jgi:hypothetical protein
MSLLDGCWIKTFIDGTKEAHYDTPLLEKSSWSQGRLSYIKEVFIKEGILGFTLEIPNTEYHQYDRYSVELISTRPTTVRKARYLQALITEEHVGFYLCYNNNSTYTSWASLQKKPKGQSYYRIQNQDVGKWITFCLSNCTSKLFLCGKDDLNGEQLFK